jgi:hypothetical protein
MNQESRIENQEFPVALLILFTFLHQAPGSCGQDAAALITSAAARVDEFDLAGALPLLDQASAACPDAQVAAIYLRGLLAARDAAASGGAVESLAPVRSAVHELAWVAGASRAPVAIAELVLQAAIAAAQYEREEMAIFLKQAVELEKLQLEARAPGAPILTAREMAAALWLQVHRFEEAQRGYRELHADMGPTGRILLGLARSAAGLNERQIACAEYEKLIVWWKARRADPPEITEAWQYVASPICAAHKWQ